MEVARATSPPMRSSMRRSTPGMGEAFQSSVAACTAARRVKSALRLVVLALAPDKCAVVGSVIIGSAVIVAPKKAQLPHHLGPLFVSLEEPQQTPIPPPRSGGGWPHAGKFTQPA